MSQSNVICISISVHNGKVFVVCGCVPDSNSFRPILSRRKTSLIVMFVTEPSYTFGLGSNDRANAEKHDDDPRRMLT